MLMRFREARTSIAVLCNVATAGTQRLAEGVADVVLGDRFPEPAKPRAAGPAAGVAAAAGSVDTSRDVGLYYAEGEQSVMRVSTREGRLYGRIPGATLPLTPAAGERFEVTGYPAAVEF